MPSTVIDHIEYDFENQQLKITFLSGSVYKYYKVPPEVYDAFKHYKSKGRVFNKFIKDKYDYDKVH